MQVSPTHVSKPRLQPRKAKEGRKETLEGGWSGAGGCCPRQTRGCSPCTRSRGHFAPRASARRHAAASRTRYRPAQAASAQPPPGCAPPPGCPPPGCAPPRAVPPPGCPPGSRSRAPAPSRRCRGGSAPAERPARSRSHLLVLEQDVGQGAPEPHRLAGRGAEELVPSQHGHGPAPARRRSRVSARRPPPGLPQRRGPASPRRTGGSHTPRTAAPRRPAPRLAPAAARAPLAGPARPGAATRRTAAEGAPRPPEAGSARPLAPRGGAVRGGVSADAWGSTGRTHRGYRRPGPAFTAPQGSGRAGGGAWARRGRQCRDNLPLCPSSGYSRSRRRTHELLPRWSPPSRQRRAVTSNGQICVEFTNSFNSCLQKRFPFKELNGPEVCWDTVRPPGEGQRVCARARPEQRAPQVTPRVRRRSTRASLPSATLKIFARTLCCIQLPLIRIPGDANSVKYSLMFNWS